MDEETFNLLFLFKVNIYNNNNNDEKNIHKGE